ncbi:MAG TPA: PfkB family carbohydrate kinase [Solirubrobacteraceae bacterium]|nr:PfkB family carbohydrate kinase [Solirubrobacteraceae bacterium]
MSAGGARVAVVGHVEWVQFARVDRVPCRGEVVHAREAFEEPAGGGAVAAVQLARLAGAATLVTTLGEDAAGLRAERRLEELGVVVRARRVPQPTRRALTLVDGEGERTITTFGARLEPVLAEGAERAPALAALDGVYFTAGDAAALRAARAGARVLVANPRARHALGHGVAIDALVLSADDELEQREAVRGAADAELVVWTEGARGGRYESRSGATGRWAPAPLGGEPADSYGCGDSFAAGLTYGLATGMELAHALALGARCGARCLTGRGPYERQLTALDL